MPNSTSSSGIVLGLIGPVCAGKSEVSRRLRELGAEIYEADAIVRSLYEEPDVKQAVRELFGDAVFEPAGKVNRAAIASRVFADAELRRRLTDEVIFPRTGRVLAAQLADFRRRAAPNDVLVVDAPTLIEAGRADWCDQILFVTASPARRQTWAAGRGWGPDELVLRDGAMIAEAEKRRVATFVIENAGSFADLQSAVDDLWRRLKTEI